MTARLTSKINQLLSDPSHWSIGRTWYATTIIDHPYFNSKTFFDRTIRELRVDELKEFLDARPLLVQRHATDPAVLNFASSPRSQFPKIFGLSSNIKISFHEATELNTIIEEYFENERPRMNLLTRKLDRKSFEKLTQKQRNFLLRQIENEIRRMAPGDLAEFRMRLSTKKTGHLINPYRIEIIDRHLFSEFQYGSLSTEAVSYTHLTLPTSG